MAKENDYFLNTIENPSYSPGDFQAAGLDASNTTIRPIDQYKNLGAIQSNPEFQTDGKFDSTKFTNAYNNALVGYNQLSTAGQGQKLASSIKTSRFDIWSDPSEREQGSETTIRLQANPNHQTIGFGTFGVTEAPTKSERENAEASDVWDPNTHRFLPSPNSTPFQNFTTPLILDTWDSDGTNIDPITGQKVAHEKGQPKLNPMGDYQYRRLYNGESLYGKQVLSGWDTLTVDGSTANKFDFFDSDDLNESVPGSLMKAAVKIVPALLPHVSPWYIGAQVTLQFGDLASKILKMATNNSNNNTLQIFETLNKTMAPDTSDYSQQHPFSFENNLNFAADTFNMLAQQRWIFKYVPAMLKGTSPDLLSAGKAGEEARAAEAAKALHDAPLLSTVDISQYKTPQDFIDAYKASDMLYTQAAVQKEVGGLQNLGKKISRVYMATAMSASAYDQAKAQGLSDSQAALFTLGYAGAQYKLLGTGIGKFILPEKKLQTFRWQNLVKTIAGVTSKDAGESKLSTMQNIIKIGRDMFNADNADGSLKKIGVATLANAISGGAEWLSFDVIGDLTKSLYNIVRPENSPALDAFDNGNLSQLATQYAQSFLGGAVGGALSIALPGMRQGKNLLQPRDSSSAWQELVSTVNNGQAEDLIKVIDKMPTYDSNLSASTSEDTGNGKLPLDGTPTDNWDYQNKKNAINIVKYVNDTLTTEGAKINDKSVMNMIAGKDRTLKYMSLLNSSMSGAFLQDYNTLATRLVADRAAIDALTVSPTDQKMPPLDEEGKKKLADLNVQLEKDRIELKSYKNGTKFKQFVPMATYELNDNISAAYTDPNFVDYVQRMDGRLFSDVPQPTKDYYQKKWNDFKALGKADQIRLSYALFEKMNNGLSDNLIKYANDYIAQRNAPASASINNAETVDKTMVINMDDPEQKIIYAAHNQSNGPQDRFTTQNKNTSLFGAILNVSDDPGKEAVDEISDAVMNDKSIPQNVRNAASRIIGSSANVKEAWARIQAIPMNADDAASYDMNNGNDNTGLKNAVPDLTKIYNKVTKQPKTAPDGTTMPVSEQSYDNRDVYSKSSMIHRAFMQQALRNDRVADVINDSMSNLSYLDHETKDFLADNNGLFSLAGYSGTEQEDFLSNVTGGKKGQAAAMEEIKSNISKVNRYKQTVNGIRYSPVEKLMDSFMQTAGGQPGTMTALLKDLHDKFGMSVAKGTARQFGYDADEQKQVETAIRICDFLQAHVAAARNDDATIGNYGYNSTVNKLTGSKLAEIDNNTAQVLAQDIDRTRTRLAYYENIFRTNSQQKLSEQPRIRARISYQKIQKTKEIFTSDFAGWKGYSVLKSVLDTAPDDVPDYDNMNKDKRKELFSKAIDVENAVHDFMTANYDKVKDGSFADYLIGRKFNLLEAHDGAINSDMKRMDDRTFFSWLASNTAMKASDFYVEYRNMLGSMGDYAPIPGQEEAVKNAYAFRLNRKVFDDYSKVYNKIVQANLDSMTVGQLQDLNRKTLLNGTKNSGLDNDYSITMPHSIFTEGGPGTGKSTAFYTATLGMLAKYHPDTVRKIWIVHISHDKAQGLVKQLSKVTSIPEDNFVPMSQEEYLRTINPEYKAHDYAENGIIITDPKSVTMDTDTQLYHYADEKINPSIDGPSLAIIDEGTRLSQQDCLMVEKFCRKYNVSQFVTGDFDQMGAIGTFKSEKESTIQVGMSRNNFIGGSRLGTSMRTENMIKDSNIADLRMKKDNAVRDLSGNIGSIQEANKAVFQYYENSDKANGETGLFGDKIDTFGDSFKGTVMLMLDTLKPGEKIGFIYQHKHTELYDWLQSLMTSKDYKDKISFVEGSSSQGDEAQYYIAEMIDDTKPEKGNAISWAKNKLNTFYTAVSRARQGTLILSNGTSDEIAMSTKANGPMKSPLSRQAIIKSIKDTKDMMSSVVTGKAGQTVLVEEGKPEKDNSGKTNSKNNDKPEDIPSNDDAEELKKEGGIPGKIQKGNVRWVDIDNDDEKSFPSLVYSMPVNETGAADNDDGTFSMGYRSQGRIDGVNGLANIKDESGQAIITPSSDGHISPDDYSKAVKIINNVKSAGLYMHSKDEMVAYIKKQLDITEDIGIDFAWKKSVLQTKDEAIDMDKNGNGRNRFTKWAKESIFGAFMGKNSNYKTNHAGQDKSVVMIVYSKSSDNGKEKRHNILEVPLFIFTSPFSMMKTKGFEDINEQFKTYEGQHNSLGSLYDFLGTDEGKKMKNADKMRGLIELYTKKVSDGNMIHYFDDKFIPSEYASSVTGPYIICGNAKGHDYIYSGDYMSSGEWTDLDKINKDAMDMSDNIYIAKDDIFDKAGNLMVGSGDAFVVTSAFRGSNVEGKDKDQGMLDGWLKQDGKGGPYSVLLVSMPKISINDYFTNFARLYKRAKEGHPVVVDKNLGNELTIFRMFAEMTKAGSSFGKIMDARIDSLNGKNDADGTTKRNYDDMDKRWDIMKKIVRDLQAKLDNKEISPAGLVSLIESPISQHYTDMATGSARAEAIMHSHGNDTSLKDYLQMEMYNMVLRFGDEGMESVLWEGNKLQIGDDIQGNISAVEEDMKKKSPNFDGIFVRATTEDNPEQVGDYKIFKVKQQLINGNPTYSIINNDRVNYGKAQTNGKVDSTAMVFNLMPMIKEITDGINDEAKNKADVIRYVSNEWSPVQTKTSSLWDRMKGQMDRKQFMALQKIPDYKYVKADESSITGADDLARRLSQYNIPMVKDADGVYHAGHPDDDRIIMWTPKGEYAIDKTSGKDRWYSLSYDRAGIMETPVTKDDILNFYDSISDDDKSYLEKQYGNDLRDQIASGKNPFPEAGNDDLAKLPHSVNGLTQMYASISPEKEGKAISFTIPSLEDMSMMGFPADSFKNDEEMKDAVDDAVNQVVEMYQSTGMSADDNDPMDSFSDIISNGDSNLKDFFMSPSEGMDGKSIFLKSLKNSIINKINEGDETSDNRDTCVMAPIKFL